MIGRAIDAVLGAGEHEAWIARMHEHSVSFGLGQDVLPRVAVRIAAEHAGQIALIAAVVAADAGEDVGLRHDGPPTEFCEMILRGRGGGNRA